MLDKRALFPLAVLVQGRFGGTARLGRYSFLQCPVCGLYRICRVGTGLFSRGNLSSRLAI